MDLNQQGESMKIGADSSFGPNHLPVISYKESLLSSFGITMEENIKDVTEKALNPEDRWYIDVENLLKRNKAFDHCLNIPVSKEEYDE
ncbi:hypothetical protein AHAS_Ahas19G0110100 [Arachis hypogaea]